MKFDIKEFDILIIKLQQTIDMTSENFEIAEFFKNWPEIKFQKFLKYIIKKEIPFKNLQLLQIAISNNFLESVKFLINRYNKYSSKIVKYAFKCFCENQFSQSSFQILKYIVEKIDYNFLKDENIEQIINLLGNSSTTITLLDIIYFHIRTEFHLSLLTQYKNIEHNLQDEQGKTALHHAVKNNQIQTIQIFLSYTDIDITIKDNNEYTALDYAIYHQQKEIITILQNHQDIDDLWLLLSKVKTFVCSSFKGFGNFAPSPKITCSIKKTNSIF